MEPQPSLPMVAYAMDYLQKPSVIAVVATLLVIAAATRILSGFKSSTCQGRQKSTPPIVPSWMPFVGHAPHMFFNADGFLASLRGKYPEGVFTLQLCGKVHHFVHKPSMATALANRPETTAGTVSGGLLVSNFGCSKKDQIHHATMASESKSHFKQLLSEPGLSDIVTATVGFVKQNIADFVTFNSSTTDQTDWERAAGADVVQGPRGETFVEADLTELTRNFIAKTANCALYGTDFVENFPDIWQLLWIFDDAFLLLASKVPAWIPWPRLQRAKVVRRRILAYTYEFNEAMDKHLRGEDPGIKWQDLDNVSALVRNRLQTFQDRGLSISARASCDLALCWAMNANANQLVPWMLFELYRDTVLLEQVREEIAPFVKVSQPINDFGMAVWVPPTVELIDIDGLMNKCPLLKAAYIETLRVYTGSWTMRRLNEDVALEDKGNSRAYVLPKGTFAHVSQEMHQMDPEYFPNPTEWHHERHLKEQIDEKGAKIMVADMGTIRPYGGGPAMCKGKNFALREMLLYTAMIITFYDMRPPSGQSWQAPKTYKPVATKRPKAPITVWIKRREQPTVQSNEANGVKS